MVESADQRDKPLCPKPESSPRVDHCHNFEMKGFIGVCLGMEVIKLPCLSNYWREKKKLFKTEFSSVMTRDLFLLIWCYPHVADNDGICPQRLHRGPEQQPSRSRKLMEWVPGFPGGSGGGPGSTHDDRTCPTHPSRCPAGRYLHTLRCRPHGMYKVCIRCKFQGLKGKTSKMMCKICNLPVHQKRLQQHQQRMLQ